MQFENRIAQSANLGMGTVITHKVFGDHAADAILAAEKETARLEAILSRFVPGSDISKVNSLAGIGCQRVSEETYGVLARAVEFSRCCEGCFDVTISPLVNLWSAAGEKSIPPHESIVRETASLVGYRDLVFEPYKNAVGLKRKDQSIDLGGIGKGFAADKILEVFRKRGISSAYTNLGGNVAALGAKPDGSPWRVGIQHPRENNSLIGAVSVVNRSVVTSGDYQRYFTDNSKNRYHHILDPKTGYPSNSGLISVTIVTDSSMNADALSTVLFVSGMDKAVEILKSFPGTEAVLVDRGMALYVTKGLKDNFQAAKGVSVKVI